MLDYQKWNEWKNSSKAAYIFNWEMKQFNSFLPNILGDNAIQFGMPEIPALGLSSMPGKILVLDPSFPLQIKSNVCFAPRKDGENFIFSVDNFSPCISIYSCLRELPFFADSIDLLILPHTLEMHSSPHDILREAARVVAPGGYLVLTGFNLYSLWSLGRGLFCMSGKSGVSSSCGAISIHHLKDWLKLLDFQLYIGRFGCYRPPFFNLHYRPEFTFMESAGERWWPLFGAVFFMVAIKRKNAWKFAGQSKKNFSPAFANLAC